MDYSGEKLNGYPHGLGMQIFSNQVTLSGIWEKGLITNIGTFESNNFKVEVEFRNGKIYKAVKIIHNSTDITRYLQLPVMKYLKEGDFYKLLD